MKARQLILSLDWVKEWLRYYGLWVPMRQSTHNSSRLLVRVHWPGVGLVFVFQRGVGVECGLCGNISI
ncbi:hypothetical protein ColKHC_04325 [Colletotrichum higginsianum]|nr:hypothetical protein ColKHC_04325 [Colletotrichum higginsianum]